ncbi:hypothetical protein FACS189419_06940 [Planctomycetales bacterium]|nr:hypothetical protein FACS189419_06940 [Planctomycetales bacterium]
MNNSISTFQIDFVRQLLASCKQVIECSPPDNADEATIENLAALRKLTDETIVKLKNPVLRLAFIGATSSGKSTLVNALIGKTLMPTEADEMSAGIVQLFDADFDYIELTVEEPSMADNAKIPDNLWEKYDDGATAEETEIKLRAVFKNYHKKRQEHSNILAPKVQIKTRLLLAQKRDLLQLPEGLNLEIIDLPGIKAVDDAANIKVIQETLKKAVLLVVLNYDETADDRMNKLLDDVGEVTKTFQSTESVFFILNKVDRWEKGDKAISQKIAELREKIQAKIQQNDVVIAPMSALRLSLFQTGLGYPVTENLTDEQLKLLARGLWKHDVVMPDEVDWSTTTTSRAKKLAKLDAEIESSGEASQADKSEFKLGQLKKALDEFRELFHSQYDKPPVLSAERLQQILDSAWQKSHGKEFTDSLSQRIRDHLPRLVIQPAVHDWQTETEETLAQVHGFCAVELRKSKEDLDKLISNLERTQTILVNRLNLIREQTEKSFKEFLDTIDKATPDDKICVWNVVAADKYIKPFEGVSRIFDSMQDKATNELFSSIRRYFNQQESEDDLFWNLKESGCVANVTRYTCDLLKRVKEVYEQHPTGEIKIREEEYGSDAKANLEYCRETIHKATEQISEMLGTFFTRNLQSSVNDFERMMSEVVENVRSELFRVITEECNVESEVAKDIIPAKNYVAKEVPCIFDVNNLTLPNRVSDIEIQTGEWTITRDRTWGEFIISMGQIPRFVEEHHEQNYIVLQLPTSLKLVESWDAMTKSALPGLCLGISGWFKKNINSTLTFLDGVIKKANRHCQTHCRLKKEEGKKDSEKRTAEWTVYQEQWNNIQDNLTDLDALINTGSVPNTKGE